MAEVLVSAVVMLLVLASAYGLFIWTWSGFMKGDDTISTVYDASILLLQLRRDMLRLDFPDGEPADLVVVRPGSAPAGFDFVASEGRLLPATSVPEMPPESGAAWICSLPLRQGDAVTRIFYTYMPDLRAVRRSEGPAGREKLYSLPRLQEFELAVGVQPDGGAQDLYLPAELPAEGIAVLQVWIRARIRVQSERSEGQAARTPVEVSTAIFPKRANGKLHARWSDE